MGTTTGFDVPYMPPVDNNFYSVGVMGIVGLFNKFYLASLKFIFINPLILISIVVREKNVEKTIQAVMKAAYTGEIGDGRIFVIPVEDAIRIRTGERGDIALYNAEHEK